jgi:5-methyltetrahydropteroyltriglutamate--homocysteine methyltransferase
MNVLVDDVGSFPLPLHVDKRVFDQAYKIARATIGDGKSVKTDAFLRKNFHDVIVESFRRKCTSGLDIVNYPQHYDMHKQLADAINEAMERGTYVVDRKHAILPEVSVISDSAREFSEEFDRRISLRVCVAGPLEMYLKIVGTVCYKDVLLMFAETVKRFAENCILDSKHIKTEVVCLDEPSLGFLDVSAPRDVIVDVLEKAFGFIGVTKQIHLHSSLRVADLLGVRGLDVLALEYAASPKNLEGLSKKMLDNADKYVRIGIARTDVDSIRAELYDKGETKPTDDQLVESLETIRRRFLLAAERYGERLLFAGPDCGLGGWPSQEVAELLLKRTVNAVKHT